MGLNLLRLLFVLLPLGLLIGFSLYNNEMTGAINKINSWQGRDGVLVINPHNGEKPTLGTRITHLLEGVFPNASAEWRYFFTKTGSDFDVIIRFVEDYWVWLLMGGFLIFTAWRLLKKS